MPSYFVFPSPHFSISFSFSFSISCNTSHYKFTAVSVSRWSGPSVRSYPSRTRRRKGSARLIFPRSFISTPRLPTPTRAVFGRSRPRVRSFASRSRRKKGIGEAELALRLQQPAQVVDRRERVQVIAPQSPLNLSESAAKEMLDEVELALLVQRRAQIADRLERGKVIGPLESSRVPRKRATQESLCFLELALLLQEDADADHGEQRVPSMVKLPAPLLAPRASSFRAATSWFAL